MKKKLLIGLSAIVMCFALVGCGSKNSQLTDIAKKFNESETVKSYKNYGYDIKASVKGNTLVVSSKIDNKKTSVSFDLKGDILSNDKLSLEELMTAMIVIDSVGQLQGYKDGQLIENLNAFPDEIRNYTIENEGFEFKDNGDTSSIKIDITKKIPLIDISNLYLSPDTFDIIKDIVENNSNGNQTGVLATLAYDVQVKDDYNYIYIGEKDALTNSAYKSIISALEVLYGSEIAEKFKTLYPTFVDGKTTVDAFTIDTNYVKEDADESVFKDKKIVLVTIDNSNIGR